ncbi:hypothetical protein [Murimonas intestini]|uniref:DUF5011 domain-containing protein n=1 Tax=Murimonas intestini TaxID=1337051 RepID=A0AB73T6E1_9FIRM|nr:hypothetical protein [Murimonas intestini]MCR1839615.1 hypothetical protein [Murimonas intestini]MCR1866458.1 hypothetical protein [Murimonas intestini]MCR1882424.1 hypothetical protein [Murimonas intestini]
MKKAGIILGILCLAAIIGGWKYTEYKRSQIDLEGPVLTAADDKVRVPIGAPDSELIKGVTAWDEKDKDVSGSIVIESINKKPDGESNEFEITYAAFDNSNNSGKLTRTLIYRDYRQPHFGISQPLRFSRNQNLSLFDYITADDCLDGDITPFVVIEGEKDIVAEAKTGIYNFTLQVSNSVGDTSQLPIQVEIFEDSYEEQMFRPKIVLSDYLIYITKGRRFSPEDYLDHIEDKGTLLIDRGPMVEVEEKGEVTLVTEKEANESPGSWVNISRIDISSDVKSNVPGIYSVVYSYTSEDTGYDCSARLIVVVE